MFLPRTSRAPKFCRARSAFSLVEALVAVAVTAIAGAALLTSVTAAVISSAVVAHRAVARGLAEQLMDEIAAVRFPGASNTQPAGSTRAGFDDIDDYSGLVESPPRTRDGQIVGTEGGEMAGLPVSRVAMLQPDLALISRFTRETAVERVRPAANGNWEAVAEHTDFRRVTVRVLHSDARGNRGTAAEITRIFAHVPVAP